jgi:hypothetical protein
MNEGQNHDSIGAYRRGVATPQEEVKTRLSELDHEIAQADSMDFKDMLKRHRESVLNILEKLLDSAGIAI